MMEQLIKKIPLVFGLPDTWQELLVSEIKMSAFTNYIHQTGDDLSDQGDVS